MIRQRRRGPHGEHLIAMQPKAYRSRDGDTAEVADLLRSHVLRRAGHHARAGEPAAGAVALGYAEIHDLSTPSS